jgi:pimeloyl-ACP methyl ester carboxylesterase
MAISEELGDQRSVELSGGTIHYRERGAGPPIVFVHGVLVNADLWRKVVPPLADGHRCIAPDWPLGSHAEPMKPDADLSPPGVAALIAEFLEALDLRDVTVVGNDTGGAITQILMTEHPERIGRVVLTPSDSFERFFPRPFNVLPRLLRVPGMTWVIAQTMRVKALHRTPLAFGLVTRTPIPAEIVRSYLGPMRRSAGVRRDLRRFVTRVHRRYTLAAAEKLSGFDRPVLLAWASEDRLFPLALAKRLAERLPDVRLVEIADSYTFVPEDQPERLVELIGATTAGGSAERHPAHPAGPVEGHPGGADLDGSPAVR